MLNLKIEGANVQLARNQPEYRTLWAKVEAVQAPGHLPGVLTNQWQCAFEPTPDELARLVAGAPVIYTVVGLERFAPMRLEVGEVPKV